MIYGIEWIKDRKWILEYGLHLTPKGQSVIKEAYPVWLSAQQKAVGAMGPETRATLDGLLGNAERLVAD